MIPVTIRAARESDRKVFPWELYRVGYEIKKRGRPIVVTCGGEVYLILGENNYLLYKKDSAAIPRLLRMVMSYIEMQGVLYDNARDRRTAKAEAEARESMDWMRRMADAETQEEIDALLAERRTA